MMSELRNEIATMIESRDPLSSEIYTPLRFCIIFHYKNFLCAIPHLILFLSIKSSTKASRESFSAIHSL